MSACRYCRGPLTRFRVELDVSNRADLIPVVLGCQACHQPIRLLHKHGVPRALTKVERKRLERAQRRRGLI